MNSSDRQPWSPRMRSGWAFPGLNFAGKGFRYNLGARPRSSWDFVAKIHDLNYYANDLQFSFLHQSGKKRSKLEKADYIFRLMSKKVERSTNEEILNLMSKFVFCGRDKSKFLGNDNFINIIKDKSIKVENAYLMIPWSAIPNNEKARIESIAHTEAIKIFDHYSLKDIRKRFKINTSKRRKPGSRRRLGYESSRSRNKRVISYISEELKYNTTASVDEQAWRDWAAEKFQDAWPEVKRI